MKNNKEMMLKWYCRQIGRKLTCKGKTKTDLLTGYSTELEEQIPNDISKEKLIATFGTPASVAAELQDSVSEEEVRQVKLRRKCILIAAAVTIVLLCAALFAWYVNYRNNTDIVYYKEEIFENIEDIEGYETIV